MTHPDLAAFIPTNEVDARTVGWGVMPCQSLLALFRLRASQGVVRADDPWLKRAGNPPDRLASGAITRVSHDPSGRGRWVEFEIG